MFGFINQGRTVSERGVCVFLSPVFHSLSHYLIDYISNTGHQAVLDTRTTAENKTNKILFLPGRDPEGIITK